MHKPRQEDTGNGPTLNELRTLKHWIPVLRKTSEQRVLLLPAPTQLEMTQRNKQSPEKQGGPLGHLGNWLLGWEGASS